MISNPPSLTEGVAHLDGPVEPLEPLSDLFHPGQRLALGLEGADEASGVDDEGADVGRRSGGSHVEDPTVALGLQQGEQEPDVPLGTDLGRRGLRALPREHGQVGDMADGDGVVARDSVPQGHESPQETLLYAPPVPQ